MNGWTKPIQQASFKGVTFDVIAVDEQFDKAVAEHAYPFVNGADLEDMGLEAQTVTLQAVCFGKGYYTQYKKLLSVIQERGADVLVHPVRGRMQNMLLTSARLHHDAENINYVSIDLTFTEATPAQPIFVFESSLLNKIDRYLALYEQFVNDMVAWWSEVMDVVAFAHNIKDRVAGIVNQWSGIYGCIEQVATLFEVDKSAAGLSLGVSQHNFKAQSRQALQFIHQTLSESAAKRQFNSPLGVRAEFSELMRDVSKVLAIPQLLVAGQHQRINSAAQFFARQSGQRDVLNAKLSTQDVASVNCALHLTACAVLAKTCATIIEQQVEQLTPTEIEYITQQSRLLMSNTLVLLRSQLQDEQTNAGVDSPNTGLYTANHTLSERLRNMAGGLMLMALSAINQKPPLTVKEVRFDAALVQVAHDFYGDWRRADELLRLNPQLQQPNFVEQGTLLNAYAR